MAGYRGISVGRIAGDLGGVEIEIEIEIDGRGCRGRLVGVRHRG